MENLNKFHQKILFYLSGWIKNKADLQCPESIIDYNKHMSGVDRADQRKESYSLD